MTPTVAFIRFSGMRVSGARRATPSTITAASATTAPTTAPTRCPTPPSAITISTTSTPSSSTPLNAVVTATQCSRVESAALRRLELLGLVVLRLQAGLAKDRLVQPAQPEEQQEDADDHLRVGDRERVDRGAERDDDHREHDRRERGAGERRAPAAEQPDGEHDRERLDPLDAGGEERRDDDERAQSSTPWSKTRRGFTRTITRSTGVWNGLPS